MFADDAQKAEGLSLLIDWTMSDEGTSHRLTLSHGALSHSIGTHRPGPGSA